MNVSLLAKAISQPQKKYQIIIIDNNQVVGKFLRPFVTKTILNIVTQSGYDKRKVRFKKNLLEKNGGENRKYLNVVNQNRGNNDA